MMLSLRCFLFVSSVKSCPIFYSTFGALAIGERFPLDFNLDVVGATEPEKEALEKIQDCYNEKGLLAKGLDLIVMVIYQPFPSPPPPPQDTQAVYCNIAQTDRPQSGATGWIRTMMLENSALRHTEHTATCRLHTSLFYHMCPFHANLHTAGKSGTDIRATQKVC